MGTGDQKGHVLGMAVPFGVDLWDVSESFFVTFGF